MSVSSHGYNQGGPPWNPSGDQNRSQSTFRYLDCGYENHADYNAAKNIGVQYLHGHQTGDNGGAPVGVRLNSGILSRDGIKEVPSPRTG